MSGVIWAIGFPAALGLGVCAHQIVALVLGKQWRDAASLLQVLAAAGVISIMASNTHYVYWALGKSKFVTALSLVGTLGFIVLTIVLGEMFGLIGVAVAQVIALSVVVIVNYATLLRTLDLHLGEVVRRNYRVVLASALMGLVVWWVGRLVAQAGVANVALQLAAMVSAGVLVFCLTLFGLWRLLHRPVGPEEELVALLNRMLGRAEQTASDGIGFL